MIYSTDFFSRLKITAALAVAVQLLSGCGTVVGNPKKPTNPPPSQGVSPDDILDPLDPATQTAISTMKLPTISFELGDLTSDDQGAAFALRDRPEQFDQNEDFKSDDTIMNQWSLRLEKIIDNMNNVTAAVNRSLESEDTEATEKKVKIKRKGVESRLSATIDKIEDKDGTRFEAAVCLGGRLAGFLTWNADQSKIIYTRDLASKAKMADDDLPLMSQLSIEKTDQGVKYLLKTSGSWSSHQPANADGPLFVDSTESLRMGDGKIELKYVADYFTAFPNDQKFEGDSYLVGRIHPTNQKAKSGKNKSQKEFVAYFKGLSQGTCRNGFDESSPTLWQPKANEPRFCLGRPLASNRFKTTLAFYETLSSLKSIGVPSRQSLAVPAFKAGLSCDE